MKRILLTSKPREKKQLPVWMKNDISQYHLSVPNVLTLLTNVVSSWKLSWSQQFMPKKLIVMFKRIASEKK
jgi:hypothetical protein